MLICVPEDYLFLPNVVADMIHTSIKSLRSILSFGSSSKRIGRSWWRLI